MTLPIISFWILTLRIFKSRHWLVYNLPIYIKWLHFTTSVERLQSWNEKSQVFLKTLMSVYDIRKKWHKLSESYQKYFVWAHICYWNWVLDQKKAKDIANEICTSSIFFQKKKMAVHSFIYVVTFINWKNFCGFNLVLDVERKTDTKTWWKYRKVFLVG